MDSGTMGNPDVNTIYKGRNGQTLLATEDYM